MRQYFCKRKAIAHRHFACKSVLTFVSVLATVISAAAMPLLNEELTAHIAAKGLTAWLSHWIGAGKNKTAPKQTSKKRLVRHSLRISNFERSTNQTNPVADTLQLEPTAAGTADAEHQGMALMEAPKRNVEAGTDSVQRVAPTQA
jgi:hypothetical protein